MGTWRVIADVFDPSVGYDYPVVRHIFAGKTVEEARGHFDAHLDADPFLRECLERNEYDDAFDCLVVVYQLPPTDHLLGGEADFVSHEDFDPVDLHIGMIHELEHTTDEDIAREIAADHLAEDPQYYQKLARIED